MKTFDILQEYRALEELLIEVDEETGEFINSSDDIIDYIEGLDNSRNKKLDNIERLKREIEAKNNALELEIKRLQAYKKSNTLKIDNLKSLQMYLTKGEKLETDLYKFSTRKSESVNIIDEEKIFERGAYAKITKTADKTAIKKAIKAGEKVLGAELVEKISLTVK